MVELSAFADEVTSEFSGQIKFLVLQGIKKIELRFVNGKNIMELSKKELIDVKKILDNNGIGVSAIGSPIGKITIDKPFNQHLDKFKHSIELADYFDSTFIRVFSYYAPDGENIQDYREEVIHRMSVKAELLKDSKIIMVHENESLIYGHSAKKCVDIVESVKSPRLKLAYDPGNFVWGNKITDNVKSCWPLMKPYVAHVHIKDWKLGNTVGVIPGEGDGQILELLKELSENNYSGFITMEPHLRVGGQFGGHTGPELFANAITATLRLCIQAGLNFKT